MRYTKWIVFQLMMVLASYEVFRWLEEKPVPKPEISFADSSDTGYFNLSDDTIGSAYSGNLIATFSPENIVIVGGGSFDWPLAIIYPDGEVDLNPDYPVTEPAMWFWEAVSANAPCRK